MSRRLVLRVAAVWVLTLLVGAALQRSWPLAAVGSGGMLAMLPWVRRSTKAQQECPLALVVTSAGMATTTVVDPEGRTWRVRRRWVHRSVSWRGPKGGRTLDFIDGADLLGAGADLPGVGVILVAIAALLIGVLAVIFVIPALIFAVELALVLVAVGLGVLARILFGRPWTVEARVKGTNEGREWKVTGWRASGDLVGPVAKRLEATGKIGDVTWTP